MNKRPRTSEMFNTSMQRSTIHTITSPPRKTPTQSGQSSSSTTFTRTNSSNNGDTNMIQKMEALETLIKKVGDENAELKATVEELKSEVVQLKEVQDQRHQKVDELETILKSRRSKIQTDAIFRSTPEMSDAFVNVRFASVIAKFFLRDLINFDMENKALDEVAKLIAIKMFEQLIPEGCTLANFSVSSTPRFGYITVPSNLFDELAEKLVLLTQGQEDRNLKHLLLLRINFGLSDKIKRARKIMRTTEPAPEA